MADKWGEFIRNMLLLVKQQTPVQTLWATCKEIQWEEKTMTVTTVLGDLDMWDCWLGFGSVMYRPKIGTKCLLGLVDNNPGLTYLIFATEVEEIHFNTDKLIINDGKNGGLIKIEELKKELNKTKALLDSFFTVLKTWVPPGADNGVGATAMFSALKLAAADKETGDYSKLENDKVKH